jgi:hypothetical protein
MLPEICAFLSNRLIQRLLRAPNQQQVLQGGRFSKPCQFLCIAKSRVNSRQLRSDLFDINPHGKGRVVDEQGEFTGVTVVDMRGVGAEGWFAVLRKNQLVFGEGRADGVSGGQFMHRAGFCGVGICCIAPNLVVHL